MIKYFIKFGNHLNDFCNIFSLCNILWCTISSLIYSLIIQYQFQNGIFSKILLFGFWTTLLQMPFAKDPFNIRVVDV
jgi:hypothetical protein